MEQFPSNSKRPQTRERDEPKKVERVVQGGVVRRKTPLGRRFLQNLIGGDTSSVGDYVFGDVIVPAFRAMVFEAFTGGLERTIYPDGRSRGRVRPGHGPVSYNRISSKRYEEPRRELSRRARATHNFEEIILDNRVEAEAVLDKLDDLCDRYDSASVADLYELIGVSGQYTDHKFGWTDIRDARVERVRNGYLLNLPRPEPLD